MENQLPELEIVAAGLGVLGTGIWRLGVGGHFWSLGFLVCRWLIRWVILSSIGKKVPKAVVPTRALAQQGPFTPNNPNTRDCPDFLQTELQGHGSPIRTPTRGDNLGDDVTTLQSTVAMLNTALT